MQLRHEPQVGLQFNLVRLAIISASSVGLLVLLVFFVGSMITSTDTRADSETLNSGGYAFASLDPFSSMGNGDTIIIHGDFYINQHYSTHHNHSITLIVDGSNADLMIRKGKKIELGSGSSIVLMNGGTISTYNGCNNSTAIYFGSDKVASCNGSNGSLTFSQVNSAGGINPDGTQLPVSWLEVNAEQMPQNEVKVEWSTASEENNSHFDVEYSIDGETWNNAGTVYSKAVNGFSNDILEYEHKHFLYESSAQIYYRIKQTDHDFQYDYSDVIVLKKQDNGEGIKIGNLGEAKINVMVPETMGQGQINIYDLTGALIKTTTLSDNNSIQLEKAGVYIIEVVKGNDVKRQKHYVS